eukprot:Gb_09052 [translate_table: standard]
MFTVVASPYHLLVERVWIYYFPVHNRFLLYQRRWGCCWSGFSCFGSQKRGKRIVPSRIPDGNAAGNRIIGAQPVGGANQSTALTPSLLAPPSSPASFTNSGNPSSVQSPNGFLSLSANVCSPGGPTSTMFATGPYAHETQLVSPPVFSTFTTEPSTAPFTPPPELAHLTTPSSPDVPFAQLLASSIDVKSVNKENGVTFSSSPFAYVATNDLQTAYQLYPGSPASQLVSPKPGASGSGASLSFPDWEFPAQWSASLSAQDTFPKYEPYKLFNLDMAASRSFILSQDSGGSRSAHSAEFCLDQFQRMCQSHSGCGGKQSSQAADVCCEGGSSQQNRYIEPNKPDMEQLEAYRASFGFSADEVTTANGELSEVLGDNLVISPLGAQKSYFEEPTTSEKRSTKAEMQMARLALFDSEGPASSMDNAAHDIEAQSRKDSGNSVMGSVALESFLTPFNSKYYKHLGVIEAVPANDSKNCAQIDEPDCFSRFGELKLDKKDGMTASSSIIEKWTKYKEKRTAESGVKDREFFHMVQPQEVNLRKVFRLKLFIVEWTSGLAFELEVPILHCAGFPPSVALPYSASNYFLPWFLHCLFCVKLSIATSNCPLPLIPFNATVPHLPCNLHC